MRSHRPPSFSGSRYIRLKATVFLENNLSSLLCTAVINRRAATISRGFFSSATSLSTFRFPSGSLTLFSPVLSLSLPTRRPVRSVTSSASARPPRPMLISVGRPVDFCAKWTCPIYRRHGAEMNLLRSTALIPAALRSGFSLCSPCTL